MDIEIDRGDFQRTRVTSAPPAVLVDGEVRLHVDHFGLSTNNVTYAAIGDLMRYWEFFPSRPSSDQVAWGRVPVWGFADVVESRSPHAAEGERLFGYFPMSSELIIEPSRSSEHNVTDGVAHRRALANAYNSYARCRVDPIYQSDTESIQMLLYPLFYTSYLMDDFLVDNDDFGAQQIVFSSASSKTALGAARLAKLRGRRTVALTSPANVTFVTNLGTYDEVAPYSDISSLATSPSVFVDLAGDSTIVGAVHRHFAENLTYSMIVGGTHAASGPQRRDKDLVGPRPTFLFAPSQIEKRTAQWGADVLSDRVATSWRDFAAWVATRIELVEIDGPTAIATTFTTLASGKVDPRLGYDCALERPAKEK